MGKETVTKSRKLRESAGRISPRRNMYIVFKQTKMKDKKKKNKFNEGRATNNLQGNSNKVIN